MWVKRDQPGVPLTESGEEHMGAVMSTSGLKVLVPLLLSTFEIFH